VYTVYAPEGKMEILGKVKITPPEVIRQLREGELSIEVRSSPKDCVEIGVWMLQPSEAPVVARRIREILRSVA
jgi:hypothetical protein